MAATLTLLALLIEVIVGYPEPLVRKIGHPVTWMGRLIAVLDRALNHEAMSDARRRAAGVVALLAIIGVPAVIGYLVERSLLSFPLGIVFVAIAASTLIAQRSLREHVEQVAAALEHDGAAAGRAAVAHIVGRDTQVLDEAGVARAAIESLAENFSDGVVAPAF
jgi:adenosylcobinamide-phosphate synthase